MKTTFTKKLTQFALALSVASIGLVGCQKEKEHCAEPKLHKEQGSAAEQNARIAADNKLLPNGYSQ
jgi:hypothetical protein